MPKKYSKYTLERAKRRVERNRGKIKGKNIMISFPGIKILGAIDYLVRIHHFRWVREIR